MRIGAFVPIRLERLESHNRQSRDALWIAPVKPEHAMSAQAGSEFERIFRPHLDAAYNLARLLLRDERDAEDVVQEAYLRAMRGFSRFRGEASRPWLLAIVRNACFTWMRDNGARRAQAEFNEEVHAISAATPETQSIRLERRETVRNCIEQLPPDFREAIVLREMEQMSYSEIAQITGVPAGTVMSRLARARARLADCLKIRLGKADSAKAVPESRP
jgi:RNA polymerase sigma factor (sigma-70 family)